MAYTSSEIKEFLKGNGNSTEFIKKIHEYRQYDVLLGTVMDMKNIVLNQEIFDLFHDYFLTISSLSAYTNAVKLVERIKAKKSASTMAQLLRILVSSAQLLSAIKLREYVKCELVELHAEIFAENPEIAAQLSISIFYTILMEICYLSDISDEDILQLNSIWDEVLAIENSDKCAILQFESFLLYNWLQRDDDSKKCVKNIIRENLLENVLEKYSNSIDSYKYILFEFLMENISTIFLTFPKKKLSLIFEFLLKCAKKFHKTSEFFQQFETASNLHYNSRNKIVQQFMNENVCNNYKKQNGDLEPKFKRQKLNLPLENGTNNCKFDELKTNLPKMSNMQLDDLVLSIINNYNETVCSKEYGTEVIKSLDYLMQHRKNFIPSMPLKLFEFMLAENPFKTNSLKFATKLLKYEQKIPNGNTFISFCMGFIVPVSSPKQTSLIDFEEVHEYVLAKLEFLLGLFRYSVKIVRNQVALIVQCIPDFFYHISLCRENKFYEKAEQLEVMLSKLCKSMEKEKELYHRYVPFIISNILDSLKRLINYPTYILLSICNDQDLALLSTNLQPSSKHKFATIYSQFYRQNKIIG